MGQDTECRPHLGFQLTVLSGSYLYLSEEGPVRIGHVAGLFLSWALPLILFGYLAAHTFRKQGNQYSSESPA